MNTYEVTSSLFESPEIIMASSRPKARYKYWFLISDWCTISFEEFLRYCSTSIRIIGKTKSSDYFTKDIEGFNRVLKSRGITFVELGMKIEVDGKKGVIVGHNCSQNLDVMFAGQDLKSNVHPYWRTKYFDKKGNLIKEFKGE